MVTNIPMLIGDLPGLVLFTWAELCVISHYQNIKDGIREDFFGNADVNQRDGWAEFEVVQKRQSTDLKL